MSIVFDQNKQFTYIYRYVNGVYETTNLAGSTAWDLFNDDAVVDDAIIFGRYNPSWSFHDLKFNIGTALVATDITVVWEYMDGTSWIAIPGVTDGTNAFQNTGINTVAFDVPQNMCYNTGSWYRRIDIGGYKSANWVRCRITSVSGITEGGRTQTDTVKYKDFTITCSNETLTLASLQSASDSGSWLARIGVNAIDTTGEYTIIRPHMYWTGTTSFAETMKMIELGEENYPAGFRHLGSGAMKLGIQDASGKGDKGCYLFMHARFDAGYDYVYNLQAYATVISRREGRYGAFAMSKVFKFVDSVFISDRRWYLTGGIQAGSEWTRSVYADPDLLYLYSGNLAFDTFKSLDDWQGVLCGVGRPATFKNTDINGKKVMRYYTADIDLIDCINIDKSKLTSVSPNNNYESLHIRIKYNLNYHIIDKDNNNVSGASVILKDKDGTEVFNVTTDVDGKIAEQTVLVYDKWWERDAGWLLHEDDYNDFSLEITSGGKSYVMNKFTIDAPVEDKLQLQSGGSINKSFSKLIKL